MSSNIEEPSSTTQSMRKKILNPGNPKKSIEMIDTVMYAMTGVTIGALIVVAVIRGLTFDVLSM